MIGQCYQMVKITIEGKIFFEQLTSITFFTLELENCLLSTNFHLPPKNQMVKFQRWKMILKRNRRQPLPMAVSFQTLENSLLHLVTAKI